VIFLTTGTHEPFDRLVMGVDAWAVKRKRSDIFGQIASSGSSGYVPNNIKWVARLPQAKFTDVVQKSKFVIAHAGIGTILSALGARKPIVVLPRRGNLRETRNDHQVATAERFGQTQGIHVAMTENELPEILDYVDRDPKGSAEGLFGEFASDELIRALKKELKRSGS
jgi:UDP-N-acetylglucosamine transferase subunit ALG13